MSDYSLTYPDGQLPLAEVPSTVGEPGINIGPLLKTTGHVTLDHGFMNTAACTSAITYIDGDAGILRYRGYPIEQLAQQSTFLETSYLLIYGALPSAEQLDTFKRDIRMHTMLHEDLRRFFDGFPRDAHPMAVLSSAVSALSTFYQDSLDPFDDRQVEISTIRLLAKVPTIAAYAHKKAVGQPFMYPDNSLGFIDNFLRMTFGVPAEPYEVNPVLSKALNQLLLLHADHEQNCSTSTVRLVGSSHANLFASVSAGINALFGPLHGGANQAVMEMLQNIHAQGGGVNTFIRQVKDRQDGVKLMGFGQEDRARRVRAVERVGPPARHRAETRRGGARRRLLHRAQALPERRLLHGPDLQGDGLPDRDVHRSVRPRSTAGVDRSVARDDQRPGHQDRAASPGVHRRTAARLRPHRVPLTASLQLHRSYRGQSGAWRMALRPPQVSVRGTTSMAPVCEFLR